MKLRHLCTIALFAAAVVFAQDSTERDKLNGAWQAQEQGNAHGNWTLQAQGEAMHLINSQADKKVSDFMCDLGKECEVKDAGKKVKVTMYFNGSKLVVMETRGEEVFKRRFGMASQGDVLELEMIPVSPAGSTQTVRFNRVPTAASAKP